MIANLAISPYWYTRSASETLRRITVFEEEKSYRPTVVVPIIDYAGRPLLVRQNTPEGNWGLVQGHIEVLDAHPLAAGRREAYEEAFVTDGKVAALFPYLGEEGVDLPHHILRTGYARGGYYVFVGIKLKPGADVSVIPPLGYPQDLSERRWCSSLDQAVSILREQPGTKHVSASTMEKIERALIPALESIYRPQAYELLELLEPIS